MRKQVVRRRREQKQRQVQVQIQAQVRDADVGVGASAQGKEGRDRLLKAPVLKGLGGQALLGLAKHLGHCLTRGSAGSESEPDSIPVCGQPA